METATPPVATLDDLRTRHRAAQSALAEAQRSRRRLGEKRFAASPAAQEWLALAAVEAEAARLAVRSLQLLGGDPALVSDWNGTVGLLTGVVNISTGEARDLYEALLLETVQRLGLQGVQVRTDSTGQRTYRYHRIRPRSWGNRDRFHTQPNPDFDGTDQSVRYRVVDSVTQQTVGHAGGRRQLTALIEDLEADTPLPAEGVVEI